MTDEFYAPCFKCPVRDKSEKALAKVGLSFTTKMNVDDLGLWVSDFKLLTEAYEKYKAKPFATETTEETQARLSAERKAREAKSD